MMRIWLSVVIVCSGLGSHAGLAAIPANAEQTGRIVDFVFKPITGIGREAGVCRRDPSDVIKVNDLYFVWYTFDSYRVDDSCLLVRDGRYWLYYKGRQYSRTPGQTKMGVAIANDPRGPYVKVTDVFPDHSILSGSHEALVWPEGSGVAALASLSQTIQFAADGLHFHRVAAVRHRPVAPGGYRPDAFTNSQTAQAMPWGISMVPGRDPYLRWFGMPQEQMGGESR